MRRALDSLVAQTYRDYEVILVDDGSTDGSPGICEEYAQKYPYFRVIHKCNGGLSSARNTGMAEAKGEWITFCDPDDVPSEYWLANYAIDSCGDADIITQGFKADTPQFGPDHTSNLVNFTYDGNASNFWYTLKNYNVLGYTWCKLYRHDIIKANNLRFDEKIRLAEDDVFLINYLRYVSRAISRKEIGYYYFVPDWEGKYRIKKEEADYFWSQIYSATVRLPENDEYVRIRNFYIDSHIYEQMLEFSRTHRREDLRKIRTLVVRHLDNIRLSSYLKTIIRLDKSLTISWIALSLHMQMKKILGK